MKEVRIDRDLLAAIRRHDKAVRKRLGEAIAEAQESFGDPHKHTGAAIRKLKGSWYETRAGLGMRILFKDCGDCLSFEFMGNHDEVRRFLKGVK